MLSNLYETWWKYSSHECFMFQKYQLDWIKIVDFLLIAKFWAFLLFFETPSIYNLFHIFRCYQKFTQDLLMRCLRNLWMTLWAALLPSINHKNRYEPKYKRYGLKFMGVSGDQRLDALHYLLTSTDSKCSHELWNAGQMSEMDAIMNFSALQDYQRK